jgi:AAA+ ATPase superfamily predicted ATPase
MLKLKYSISDNFLSFWFRFIYKHRSALEAGNLDYLNEIIARDYNTYSGKILEKYFIEKLKMEKKYNTIGTYWERGNENEIDIVAVNDIEKVILFAEVKRNKSSISVGKLVEKSARLLDGFKDYKAIYVGYGLEDL